MRIRPVPQMSQDCARDPQSATGCEWSSPPFLPLLIRILVHVFKSRRTTGQPRQVRPRSRKYVLTGDASSVIIFLSWPPYSTSRESVAHRAGIFSFGANNAGWMLLRGMHREVTEPHRAIKRQNEQWVIVYWLNGHHLNSTDTSTADTTS